MGEVRTARIVFNGSEDTSSSELGGAMPSVVNAIMDKSGAARRRPGMTSWPSEDGAPSGNGAIIGMIAFKQFLVFIDENRMIYAFNPNGAPGYRQIDLSTSTDFDTKLDGQQRPCMVAGRDLLLMCGGGAIQKWDGVTAKSERLENTGGGTNPPTPASFMCLVAQRLIVTPPSDSGIIVWTGPLEDYEDWDFATSGHAGYTQASAKPDPIKAIADNTNEIYAFGNETTQVFAPSALTIDETDPNNVSWFAPSRTINIGTVSPFSVTPYDDSFAMLDRFRRVIVTDARSYKDISPQVATKLRAMESIEDCWSFRMKFGRHDAVVFMFPTDGFGLYYDFALGNWGEWVPWDGPLRETNDHGVITSAYNWSEIGAFLVGTEDGTIASLDEDVTTDLYNPINIRIVSGFTNHGTMANKDCRSVSFMFKRTWEKLPAPSGRSLSASGQVRIWNRDDLGAWEHVADIELSSDPCPVEVLRSLGVYRSRQWKVEYDGADEIELVGAEEEFVVLGE